MPEQLAMVLIFLVSGFTMCFAGFGFAMVSVPLLGLLLPIREAVALQFPYCLILFLHQAWLYRKHFAWQPMRPLVVGAVLGLGVGTFMIYNLPDVALKRVLAGIIAVTVLLSALPAGRAMLERYAHNPWWGRAFGFLCGSFLGAYSIGGPQAALYIMSVTKDPRRAKSLLAFFFSAQLLITAVIYTAGGMFTWPLLGQSLAYSPVVAVGSALGFWAFARASSRLYRNVVLAMLLVTAVVLWWQA